jgi:hypothetical protein
MWQKDFEGDKSIESRVMRFENGPHTSSSYNANDLIGADSSEFVRVIRWT